MEGADAGNDEDTVAAAKPPPVPQAQVKKKGGFKGKRAWRKFTRNLSTNTQQKDTTKV